MCIPFDATRNCVGTANVKKIRLGWGNGVFNTGGGVHDKKYHRAELPFSARRDYPPGKVMHVAQCYRHGGQARP